MRAYLDHASTSPLRPAARDAMLPFLESTFGDPGRLHAEGRATRVALEAAREQVAAFFGARPREVVFTASGTEAVNAAVFGDVGARRRRSRRDDRGRAFERARRDCTLPPTTSPWSASTAGPCRRGGCRRRGARRHALVAVQLANHEVGTVQPVAAACDALRERDVLVHVDACAAAGHVAVDFRALDADSSRSPRTSSAARRAPARCSCGAGCGSRRSSSAARRSARAGPASRTFPRGSGSVPRAPTSTLRPNQSDPARSSKSRRRLRSRLPASTASVIGALPNLVCLGVDGVEAEPILLALDQHGVAVHSGSSCSSETLEPSPVLAAMGVDADRSLRVSVGWSSTRVDVERFVEVFPGIVERLRGLRSAMTTASYAGSTTRCSTCATHAGAPRSTPRLSASRSSASSATARRCSCAPPRPRTTTTSGCSRSARRPRHRNPAAPASTTSRGRSTRSRTSPRCASACCRLGALVGESDHGVSKSLYAKDVDGNEFEVLWTVPSEQWGDARARSDHRAI